jgi:nitrate/nitrite-specific signal transduction histidine kinase
VESLVKVSEREAHAYDILQIKHTLAQQLRGAESWQELTDRLYEFIGRLIPNARANLLIPTQDWADLEVFAPGKDDVVIGEQADFRSLARYCPGCVARNNSTFLAMHSCDASEALQPRDLARSYCFPISMGGTQASLMQLYLAPESPLSNDQVDILNNIYPEITMAIKITQQHIALSNALVVDAAVATRREISRDLHDTLGQNLSYLNFKLDEFTRNGFSVEIAEIKPHLVRMQATASEALELLREMLAGMHSGTQSRPENYLREYGELVGKRDNFDFKFSTTGTPFLLTTSTLRQINYVYRQAINNIEKHAGAHHVDVRLDWLKDELNILIEDDGMGFDPDCVQTDRHLGILIMRERMDAINGSVHIDSSVGAGTRLTIKLPLVT